MHLSVSVITCSLKGIELNKTVQSLLAQEFKDWELIVVAPIENYVAKSLRDRWDSPQELSQLNDNGTGTYAAMNLGARNARARNLMFLNEGDEFFDRYSLSALSASIESHEWAYGRLLKVDNVDKQSEYRFEPYSKLLHRFGWKYVPHPASIISRNVFESLGGFDERHKVAADQRLFLQMSKMFPPRVLSKPTSKFYLGGLSTRSVKDSMQDLQQVSNELFGPILGMKPLDNLFWFFNTLAKIAVKRLSSIIH